MTDYGKLLGCRFFKSTENDREIIKAISFVSPEVGRFLNLKTGETKKLKFKDVIEEYNLLNPDGFITFSIVNLDNGVKDVIISMSRTRDIFVGEYSKPYCICRQNIVNIYNEIIKRYDVDTFVGMTMSIETVPEGIDYDIMLACNSIEHYVSVAYYIDDKLSDILQCIRKISKYDEVLEKIFMDNCNRLNPLKWDKNKVSKMSEFGGYCKDLLTLILTHDFMYEVRRGFHIGYVDICITKEMCDEQDSDFVNLKDKDLAKLIETYEFGDNIRNIRIIRFTKDIDVKNIKVDHIMFADKNENIFICIYDDIKDIQEDIGSMSTSAKLNMILEGTSK